MTQSRFISVLVAAFALATAGCATQDIPQAHRGRLFGRTGFFSFYSGASGPTGPNGPIETRMGSIEG